MQIIPTQLNFNTKRNDYGELSLFLYGFIVLFVASYNYVITSYQVFMVLNQ